MSRLTLIRMCAVSAILGGTLRIIASFIPETASGIYLLYFAIDVFLLLGVVGLFRTSVTGGNVVGLLGFVIVILALLVLLARDVGMVPPAAYAPSAAAFSLGLDLLAIQVLRSRKLPIWIPISWILSTILGPVGFFVPRLHFLFAVSGLLFGTAFASAGLALWNLSSNSKVDSHQW